MVNRIVDIVDEQLDVKTAGRDRRALGVLGCAVIKEKVTELLDLDALLKGAGVVPFAPHQNAAGGEVWS